MNSNTETSQPSPFGNTVRLDGFVACHPHARLFSAISEYGPFEGARKVVRIEGADTVVVADDRFISETAQVAIDEVYPCAAPAS